MNESLRRNLPLVINLCFVALFATLAVVAFVRTGTFQSDLDKNAATEALTATSVTALDKSTSARLGTQATTNDQLGRQIADLKTAVATLPNIESRLQTVTTTAGTSATDIKAIQATLPGLTAALTQLNDTVQKIPDNTSDLTKMRADLTVLSGQLQQYKDTLTSYQTQISRIGDQVDGINTYLDQRLQTIQQTYYATPTPTYYTGSTTTSGIGTQISLGLPGATGNGVLTAAGNPMFAETFIVATVSNLTVQTVRVRLANQGGIPDGALARASIRNTVNGVPTDEIAYGFVTASTIPAGGFSFVSIPVNNVTLNMGLTYALVMQLPAPMRPEETGVNSYAGGILLWSTNGGTNWSSNPASDICFEIVGRLQ